MSVVWCSASSTELGKNAWVLEFSGYSDNVGKRIMATLLCGRFYSYNTMCQHNGKHHVKCLVQFMYSPFHNINAREALWRGFYWPRYPCTSVRSTGLWSPWSACGKSWPTRNPYAKRSSATSSSERATSSARRWERSWEKLRRDV